MTDSREWLADLDPDPWELDQLDEVMAETDAEGPDYGYDGDPDPGDDLGPWDDSAARLAEIGDTLGQAYATDAQRAAEDAEDTAMLMLRPSAEDKLARARQRIEAGTYTPPPSARAARDAEGMFSVSCGEAVDATGRCASRYHRAGCHTVTEAAAATGSADEARAWNATLRGMVTGADVAQAAAEREAGLASPSHPQPGGGLDTWAELLSAPADLGPADAHQRMLAELGAAELQRAQGEPLPDVGDLAREMGLR